MTGGPGVPEHGTVLGRLADVELYLEAFDESERAAPFERLIAESFACLLHLPLYDASSDPEGETFRVKWLGEDNACAPQGPDARAWAYGWHLVVEATLKTAGNQWTQELGPCVEHAQAVAEELGESPGRVHSALVVKAIHKYTLDGAKAWNGQHEHKVVLLEPRLLGVAVETARLAFTLPHLEVRRLLVRLLGCLEMAGAVGIYRKRAREVVERWQREVLYLEQRTVVAVSSYRAMLALQGEGPVVAGVGQIYGAVSKDPCLQRYFELADADLNLDLIRESLLSERLAQLLETDVGTSEAMFRPVPLQDFKSRCDRRLKAVEAADAGQ